VKRILVTGGLGFVGSHLVDLLVSKGGCDIVVMDNLCSESSSKKYMKKEVIYWIDDVRNLNSYKYLDEKFDVIYHMAALARIQPSFKDPLTYMGTDIMGTSHVLEFARRCSAKVIYAGSSSAYAGPMLNPYAFAKYTGEQLCELYNKVYGLSTVIARFFNVYGDRQPKTGSYATVIGIFEERMLAGKTLTVTGTGKQRRDFTHVSDIVDGFVKLDDGEWNAEVFQLGFGQNYSINEVANMFDGDIEYIPKRPGEAKITLADYSEMTHATGWLPKIQLKDYINDWKINILNN
jgi:UDP-glucose 4-epimerase